MFAELMARLRGGDNGATIDHDGFVEIVRSGGAAIVDVREPHEFAAGHAPGAINLPLSRFDPAQLPQGQPVVLMCLSGARSAIALGQARQAGRADTRNYAEGMSGWRARGGAVV